MSDVFQSPGAYPPIQWKSDFARRVLGRSRSSRATRYVSWTETGFPIRAGRSERVHHLAKRVFDVAVVSISAPLWLPLLGLVALAIKVSSPTAPVFFTQRRAGRNGRTFRMLKFRSMVPNAEELKDELLHLNELPLPLIQIKDDPRITSIGRFLRKTSLDELPQLLNVLRGEMSLVGPRPTSFLADTYELWQTARLNARPGLTGLWQVTSRGQVDFAVMSRLDIRYLKRANLLLDLMILVQTVAAVLGRRGC